MKKILLFSFMLFYAFTNTNAQMAPSAVCKSETSYTFDQEITYYFELQLGHKMLLELK